MVDTEVILPIFPTFSDDVVLENVPEEADRRLRCSNHRGPDEMIGGFEK